MLNRIFAVYLLAVIFLCCTETIIEPKIVVEKDTVNLTDTVSLIDTVSIKDTIIVLDTISVSDTLIIIDTLTVIDIITKEIENVFVDNFETDQDWTIGPMFQSNFSVEYLNNGINGSKCINVTSTSGNEIFLKKWIQLEPYTLYRISAKIKGENIILNQGYKGAAIGANHVSNSSYDNTTNSFDWVEKECIFETNHLGTAELFMSFAGGGSLGTGTLMFDDYKVSKIHPMDYPVFEGDNIKLVLYMDDINASGITMSKVEEWHQQLETSYNHYRDLVGYTPYDGRKITILPTHSVGGWAVAGNPIKWERDCIPGALHIIYSTNDWSFGILHEISHDMDLDYWNYDAEAFANFKMLYVVEKANAKVFMANKMYSGDDLYKLYKTDSGASYDDFLSKGRYTGDSMAYILYKIKEIVGWDVFKQAFRNLNTGSSYPSRLNRFLNLMDELKTLSNGKFKVEDVIPQDEYDVIVEELKK